MPDYPPDGEPPVLRTAAELLQEAMDSVQGLPPDVTRRLAALAANPAALSAERIREIVEEAARA